MGARWRDLCPKGLAWLGKPENRFGTVRKAELCYNLCVATTETLSVRLTPATRRVLAEAAQTHDVAGASALARDILERWAAETLASQTKTSLQQAIDYLRGHPEGWADDPADFFRNSSK